MTNRSGKIVAAFFPTVLALVGCSGHTPPAADVAVAPIEGSTIDLVVHEDDRYALFLFAYHAARNTPGRRLRGYVELPQEDQEALARFADEFAPLAAAFEPYLASHPGLSNDLGVVGANLTGGQFEGADEKLIAEIDAFLPIYRREFAPRHRAITSPYVDLVRAEIAEYGDAMARAIAREVAGEWRKEPIRVDIAPYVTFLGAFTNPHHTVISASNQDYRDHAIEMVFHEAAHTDPMDNPLKSAANAALAEHGLDNPRFWHYLQFYAIGRAAQSVLGPDYVPYHERTGLSKREGVEYYAAIDAVWDDHDTLIERANAAAALVAARSKTGTGD